MAFARARAMRPLHAALRPRAAPAVGRTALPRLSQAGQRRWQSGNGDHPAPSSDIPWAIGAVVVTVVGSWYLWPAPHSADAGHHGEHAEHAEEEHDEKDAEEEAPAEEPKSEEGEGDDSKEESKKDEPKEEESKKDDSKKDQPKKEESKDDKGGDDGDEKSGADSKDSGDDSKEKEAPPGDDSKKSTYAGGPDDKEAQFKGKMKEGAAGHDHTTKSESMPASRGTNKKRIDSGYQQDLGAGEEYGDAATAKTINKENQGDIATKQAGLSTTATRHSTNIGEDPTKSKKGEGVPETAKSMGTVDSRRPAR